MCGRFVITDPNEALAAMFGAQPSNDLPEPPNYNVCPTNTVAVVTAEGGARRLRAMRWGFIPHWYKAPNDGPLLINARADTIAEKPAFRAAARERRCLIPARGFYEWREEGGQKLPFFIHRADGAPMVFAGVWQVWDKGAAPLATCAIVTTDANARIGAIHHRMPVILEAGDWPLWLGEAGHGAAALMRSAPDAVVEFHRVDPKVNSNRASGPDLIAPLAA
ncbi:MAG: SOS response-associated peptidase [Rhodobacteraceae bacterium]|jgi:putative SOS response-associated peptidase YedK|nr:SOS response-associated peptidase [Paracoccaceae bacterium]